MTECIMDSKIMPSRVHYVLLNSTTMTTLLEPSNAFVKRDIVLTFLFEMVID